MAEVGRSEAKVPGDLPIGISPTAPRFHLYFERQIIVVGLWEVFTVLS